MEDNSENKKEFVNLSISKTTLQNLKSYCKDQDLFMREFAEAVLNTSIKYNFNPKNFTEFWHSFTNVEKQISAVEKQISTVRKDSLREIKIMAENQIIMGQTLEGNLSTLFEKKIIELKEYTSKVQETSLDGYKKKEVDLQQQIKQQAEIIQILKERLNLK